MTTLEQIRWIPVEIEKPANAQSILYQSRDRVGCGLYEFEQFWRWDNRDTEPISGVHHWASMPTGAKHMP